ncbi:Hypothetical predicted protein, partial [Pelobates cultripes]
PENRRKLTVNRHYSPIPVTLLTPSHWGKRGHRTRPGPVPTVTRQGPGVRLSLSRDETAALSGLRRRLVPPPWTGGSSRSAGDQQNTKSGHKQSPERGTSTCTIPQDGSRTPAMCADCQCRRAYRRGANPTPPDHHDNLPQ